MSTIDRQGHENAEIFRKTYAEQNNYGKVARGKKWIQIHASRLSRH